MIKCNGTTIINPDNIAFIELDDEIISIHFNCDKKMNFRHESIEKAKEGFDLLWSELTK